MEKEMQDKAWNELSEDSRSAYKKKYKNLWGLYSIAENNKLELACARLKANIECMEECFGIKNLNKQ